MASTTTQLLNHNFGGISRKDSSFSSDLITCSDCQNVELYYTGLNSGVGLRTAKGNSAVTGTYLDKEGAIQKVIPSDESVIEIFESTLDGDIHFIVYTENEKQGKLYEYDIFNNKLVLYADGLSVTGKGFGCDYEQGWLDMFCFSNGENIRYLYYDTSNPLSSVKLLDTVGTVELFSIKSTTVTSLGTFSYDSGILTYGDYKYYRNTSSDTTVSDVSYYAWTSTGGTTYYTKENKEACFFDVDYRTVKGEGMFSFDKRLWIFDGKVLWYSEQENCKNFKGDTSGESKITLAGYIEFVKPITAIYPYLGSLAVFHKDSSSLVTVDSTTGFSMEDESPGGCASAKALVFHGTDLYFYDDTKKGVFSFQQIVNGDKTLGQNIALDIQEELMDITDVDGIRTLSVVTSDRNEIWFLTPINATYPREKYVYDETTGLRVVIDTTTGEVVTPTLDEKGNIVLQENQAYKTETEEIPASIILIYDYLRGVWVKRRSNKINCIGIVNGTLYSGNGEIFREYDTKYFNNDFIAASYTCTTFNLGEDNTLKITKFPPRITASADYNCNFWVKYIRNYNSSKVRTKNVKAKFTSGNAVWNQDGLTWNDGTTWKTDSTNYIVKLPSFTCKALEITLYTTKAKEEFCIKSIEFSKIKVKQV